MFELRAAVRSILLPVASARDEEFVNEVARYLNRLGVKEDQPNWIACPSSEHLALLGE